MANLYQRANLPVFVATRHLGSAGNGAYTTDSIRGYWVLKNRLTVLLVDDDLLSVARLSNCILNCGHRVLVAESTPAALRMVAASKPCMILMNIELQRIDGCDLARHMRLINPQEGIFLVGMVTKEDAATRVQTTAAGIDILLVNPVDLWVVETLLHLESYCSNFQHN